MKFAVRSSTSRVSEAENYDLVLQEAKESNLGACRPLDCSSSMMVMMNERSLRLHPVTYVDIDSCPFLSFGYGSRVAFVDGYQWSWSLERLVTPSSHLKKKKGNCKCHCGGVVKLHCNW